MAHTHAPVTAQFRYGQAQVSLRLPQGTTVYESSFPTPVADDAAAVLGAVSAPVHGPSLVEAARLRRAGEVVIVVSDITRPVPYSRFLPGVLHLLETQAAVPRDQITILVATGMHRVSTPAEHRQILGDTIAERYRVVDHDAADESSLAELPGKSHSGNRVRLNARFVGAGLRIVTGLVEPHFMAGFSGGRKAVCPGLADLNTVRNFHGYRFLASDSARNANLIANPLHDEALSVAKLAGVDFSLNVVLNNERRVVAALAGDLEGAHAAACALVRTCSCPTVSSPADLVVTSSGGAPLDATFYQCVKGFVSCLPTVRAGGTVLSFGACDEGVGSSEYRATMEKYGQSWRDFLRGISGDGVFVKDQWQFQMHCRALAQLADGGLHFATGGIESALLARLGVTGHHVDTTKVERTLQHVLDTLVRPGMTVVALPEGPYCAPVTQ